MTDDRAYEILLDLQGKISTLLERSEQQNRVCVERKERIDDHEKRISSMEVFIRREQAYRKLTLGMLTALMGLVSWSLNVIPSLVSFLRG